MQIIDGLKNLGWPKEAVQHLLARELGLDEADAKAYADAMSNAKPPEDAGGGGFGGGFGAPVVAPGGEKDAEPVEPAEA